MRKTVFLLSFILMAQLAAPVSSQSAEERPKVDKQEKLSQFWQEHGSHFNLAIELGAGFKKVSDHSLELNSGTFLVESKGHLSVQLPLSSWELPSKTMVLIRVSPGSERLYCLLESATAVSHKHNIAIRCGEEVLITKHMPAPHELTGEFDVGVRQLRATDLAEDRKVATMEFSIVQAMEREPLLSQISHSKHSHDKALRERLLKAAAVLNYVTSRHGPYTGY